MSRKLDTVAPDAKGALTTLTSTVTEQVRRRPLLAVGLSLAAGSLLQGRISGGQAGGSMSSMSGSSPATSGSGSMGGGVLSSASGTAAQLGSTARQTASTATERASDAASTAASTAGNVASSTAGTVADTARSAASTTTDLATSAVDTTTDAARSALSTTADVAQSAANTTGQVVGQVADTASDMAGQATDTVSSVTNQVTHTIQNLGSVVRRQIQQRPLTALGVATGAGMMLQPALAPQVSDMTEGLKTQAQQLQDSVSDAASSGSAPDQQEMRRISQALVPATVDKAKAFMSRDLRDLLERNLEGVVGQTSLRAGVVAAITEKGEEFVENRLPSLLQNNLQGGRGVALLGAVGAILQARNQARQGEGRTIEIARTNLTRGVTQSSAEQLRRLFPEFRERYEATGGSGSTRIVR